jgi:hypothetical protein
LRGQASCAEALENTQVKMATATPSVDAGRFLIASSPRVRLSFMQNYADDPSSSLERIRARE